MKTVSILGSCNSRELFNYDILKNNFDVNFYAFQTNMWDIFSKPLNLEQNIIYSMPTENFYRRMLDLDANKKIVEYLEIANSEFIVIDLFTLIRNPLKLTKDGITVYINNNAIEQIRKFLEANQKNNIKCEMIKVDDLDEALIFDGLDKLADYINKNYEEGKAIIVYPVFSKKYLNLNNEVVSFSQPELTGIEKNQKIVNKFSDYLASKIKGCKTFIPKLNYEYSTYLKSDSLGVKPNYTHHAKYDEMQIAFQLYDLIEEITSYYDKYELLCKEYNITNNLLYENINIVKKMKTETLTSLNNFVYNILDLNRHVVIISARDEASAKLNKFIAKNVLGLAMKIGKRQSYIAIVDKQNNLKKEIVSDEKIVLHHSIGDKKIDVVSSGFLCGNYSSIKINEEEFSKNKRGLNFVVLNNKTLEVVTSFSCDLYLDENLLISLDVKI